MTMIKKNNEYKASSTWSIDGVEIILWKRRNISEEQMHLKIKEYKELLQEKAYERDNAYLCGQFRFWGGLSFVKIGFVAFRESFITMFQHYANLQVNEWGNSNKVLRSKEVGISYVFDLILQHPDYDIKYDFRYILDGMEGSRILYDIVEEEFATYWIVKIQEALLSKASFCDISKRIGIIRTTRYAVNVATELVTYIEELAKDYTLRRERISKHKLHQRFFGDNAKANGQDMYDEGFKAIVKNIVDRVFAHQYEYFPKNNRLEMNVEKEQWILYGQHGPSLVYNYIDFLEIESPSLRQEVKYYVKHRYHHKMDSRDRFVSAMAPALNIIVSENPSIHYFSDMDMVDAKTLHLALESQMDEDGFYMSTTKIMGIFSKLKVVMRYLMSEHRDSTLKTPIAKENIFENYVFVNSKDYVRNTPVMPECVVKKLEEFVYELNEKEQLIFKIFSNTGLRAKEVLFLEEDCIENTRYKDLMAIRYTPYKVISARKKHHLPEHNRVMIEKNLADKINGYIEKTEDLRKEYGVRYIFINKRKGHKVSMMNMPYFVQKINNLIETHQICDEEGNLWHFTNRQYRKTLAVTLIENGATVEELAYWLGHLNRETAAKYYAEVRSSKLEEMNTVFFKEKFDLLLSKEQLSNFNEEERQLLYVDFCLEQRRVEYGYCLRKRSEGECNRRNSLFHCIFCHQLCTGKKYLEYWQFLLEDQDRRYNQMIDRYKQNGIDDYQLYKEYQQEKKLLDGYKAVIASIYERGEI
jgi:integrase